MKANFVSSKIFLNLGYLKFLFCLVYVLLLLYNIGSAYPGPEGFHSDIFFHQCPIIQ